MSRADYRSRSVPGPRGRGRSGRRLRWPRLVAVLLIWALALALGYWLGSIYFG